MVSNWPVLQLGELVKIKGGKRLPKGSALQSHKSEHPYIRVRDMGTRYIPKDMLEYVPNEVFPSIKNYIVEENDVIISIVGTIGLISIIDKSLHLASQTENCAKLSGLDNSDAHYLYYYLNSYVGQQQIKEATVGAVQAKLPLYGLNSLSVIWPERHIRENIVHNLITLDDKIELNRQTNQTLEQMAQALFKSWFVDFDPVFDNALASGVGVNDFPEALQKKAQARFEQRQLFDSAVPSANSKADIKPLPADILNLFPSEFEQTDEPSIGINGWIPKGWIVSQLSEVTTELRRGISPKYTEEGGIQVINQKCIRNHEINFLLCRRNNPELRKVAGRELLIGDVLVNSTGVGTLGRVAQVHNLPEPTVVDSHVTVVRPNIDKIMTYTFGQLMLANERRIEALGEGSTGQTELSRKILSEQKVLLPPVSIATKIEGTFKSYADKQVSNRAQISCLEKLRDTLLPKLISGELQLPQESAKTGTT
ncbi:restriction endonuclease subunit S [Pseudoalteromonas luteoviolacea]|uniref:Type I restriction modification DNA specificity domain-containing protein n=1 Tax=Pseudoalteromonas luteoviolacea DSM 6061 TaxID=1365250 RepID=A0A166XY87_9GAMM|nr:restriction endonuclease subunit S [Pseudoalteromonas luteoviolacea]KZN41036.1 hypothetical protein N475_01250 [Pseudoalteromonas luteoviolacea DSM 6061]MBE0386244.1 type I restriction enzyme, S subunit [Pseudoalteromonas luteoviolacea DSM 6061]